MTLTPAEKAAGRMFRDWCRQALLDGITADAYCPPYLVWYRHECAPSDRSVQAGTWAMQLRQTYVLNREFAGVPEGKFAYVFRFGECARCHLRVRSLTGRFVLAEDNPPEKGAAVAYQQPHGAVLADQAGAARAQ